jgi:hypothetical protein
MVQNGDLEVDHCPGKFITPDAITKKTPDAGGLVFLKKSILPSDR